MLAAACSVDPITFIPANTCINEDYFYADSEFEDTVSHVARPFIGMAGSFLLSSFNILWEWVKFKKIVDIPQKIDQAFTKDLLVDVL